MAYTNKSKTFPRRMYIGTIVAKIIETYSYAARQGMRACNNNMCNSKVKDVGRCYPARGQYKNSHVY